MNDEAIENFDWQKWAGLYDVLRYPPAVYNELVVEKESNDDRFKLLGAWKTGCISWTGEHQAYTDNSGTSYFYTRRWREDCPIGYRVWNDLANNDADVVAKVPSRLTSEVPDLVTRLCRRKGFGFIWAVFVLHCVKPEVFPLYDQHVYRAFRCIETQGEDSPNQASASWPEFRSYAKWFSECVQESSLPYWTVDRALWTFGKSVKRREKRKSKTESVPLPSFDNIRDEWVHETTFGGKKKRFWWKIDATGTVCIRRQFRGTRKEPEKQILKDELEQLQAYMGDGVWKRLSNNVAKLRDGSEQDGIGKFLVEELGWTVTQAQLAGHLGVIMKKSGVWDYNEKKTRIKHRRLLVGWRKPLTDYYRGRVGDTGQ